MGWTVLPEHYDDGGFSIQDAESDVIREGVCDWRDQVMSTRLNDRKTGDAKDYPACARRLSSVLSSSAEARFRPASVYASEWTNA